MSRPKGLFGVILNRTDPEATSLSPVLGRSPLALPKKRTWGEHLEGLLPPELCDERGFPNQHLPNLTPD